MRRMERVMKVMICGSRKVKEESKIIITERLDRIKERQEFFPIEFLLGGAIGADTVAQVWARENKIPVTIFYPVNSTVKAHYLYRNVEMIALCDEVIAFWDGESTGTKFVIDYAKARNKPVTVISI